MSEILNIDANEQLKDLMGDKYAQLVETYTRTSDQHIVNIAEGFAQGDAKRIVDSAHPLKSSSGNMGLLMLSETATQLEADAKKVMIGEADISTVEEFCSKITEVYAQSKDALMGTV